MEENRNSVKKFFEEVKNLIWGFFSPLGLNKNELKIPSEVKKMGTRLQVLILLTTVTSLTFAFVLRWANLMIEQQFIFLGILLFMLYKGQAVIDVAFRMFKESEREKQDLIIEDEIVLMGSKIIGMVSNKIFKFDEKTNQYKIMSNEAILNSIKNYLKNSWTIQIIHKFKIIEIISIISMLTVAIITNNAISQIVFIPLIIFFAMVAFFSSIYISVSRKEFYTKNKELDNQQSVVINDLLRVPEIVRNDLSMRIEKFQKTNEDSKKNITRLHKKLNTNALIITVLETCSQYGFIIFYLMQFELSEITLATIAEITANLAIVSTALGNISRVSRIFNAFNSRRVAVEKEQEDIELILQVYNTELKSVEETKTIDYIYIKPFEIKYYEQSENDKPFTLISTDDIYLKKGEIAILLGPSGSGKSTFMNLLTDRIRVEKSDDIPTTRRFLVYDEKLRFGSLSIYEEMFCLTSNPNLNKMKCILENLHLWQEIQRTCVDVWQWMKEKNFNSSLSNGQKQRLILAKMLYWLDENVDVVVLDECTSGLDDKVEDDSADAERILEYIIQYCNRDKKRIIVISTHQNIDGMKNKLEKEEFKFTRFKFSKDSFKNQITQI